MSKKLSELSQDLMQDEGKVHLIYAFNGTGKTILSNEFKKLVQSSTSIDENIKIIYYNSYNEYIFHWKNESTIPILNIHKK